MKSYTQFGLTCNKSWGNKFCIQLGLGIRLLYDTIRLFPSLSHSSQTYVVNITTTIYNMQSNPFVCWEDERRTDRQTDIKESFYVAFV